MTVFDCLMTKDELKNLPPEDRIKKLKELQEKKKKELEEAKKLIKDSESEISDRRKFKEKVPMPEFAKEDLKDLSAEAKEILKHSKGLKEKTTESDHEDDSSSDKAVTKEKNILDLETLTHHSEHEIPPEILNSEYALQLSKEPMQELYQEMVNIYKSVEEKGYVSPEEEKKVEYLASAVERKVEDVDAGNYSFTESVAIAVGLTKTIGKKIRGLYKS